MSIYDTFTNIDKVIEHSSIIQNHANDLLWKAFPIALSARLIKSAFNDEGFGLLFSILKASLMTLLILFICTHFFTPILEILAGYIDFDFVKVEKPGWKGIISHAFSFILAFITGFIGVLSGVYVLVFTSLAGIILPTSFMLSGIYEDEFLLEFSKKVIKAVVLWCLTMFVLDIFMQGGGTKIDNTMQGYLLNLVRNLSALTVSIFFTFMTQTQERLKNAISNKTKNVIGDRDYNFTEKMLKTGEMKMNLATGEVGWSSQMRKGRNQAINQYRDQQYSSRMDQSAPNLSSLKQKLANPESFLKSKRLEQIMEAQEDKRISAAINEKNPTIGAAKEYLKTPLSREKSQLVSEEIQRQEDMKISAAINEKNPTIGAAKEYLKTPLSREKSQSVSEKIQRKEDMKIAATISENNPTIGAAKEYLKTPLSREKSISINKIIKDNEDVKISDELSKENPTIGGVKLKLKHPKSWEKYIELKNDSYDGKKIYKKKEI